MGGLGGRQNGVSGGSVPAMGDSKIYSLLFGVG